MDDAGRTRYEMALLIKARCDDPIEGIIWPLPIWQKRPRDQRRGRP
jgi:hypothetical protein